MDVALVEWPSDEMRRSELAARRRPRLLLVEPDADPPECTDPWEDWVRLPVSPVDRRARIRTLEARIRATFTSPPRLLRDGTLEYRGVRTQLSAIQGEVLRLMLDRFESVVSREALVAVAWPDAPPSANNLHVTMGRLRRRVTRVGLRIETVRARGYLLTGEPFR